MKKFNIPSDLSRIRGFIFDIDNTLYRDDEYAAEQIDCQVRAFALQKGITAEEGRRMVAEFRAEWAAAHDGAKTSLANVLLHFGVPVAQSIEWRRTLIKPEEFLKPDPDLKKALTALAGRAKLLCVTNNPVATAYRNLKALDIADVLCPRKTAEDIVGLDTCGVSKPDRRVFLRALQVLDLAPGQIVSVGDRFDIDLACPLEMGMSGLLVDGPCDIADFAEEFCGFSSAG